ncbi:hypothetical protein chiPu_0017754 [Chiloscyllium punctatum]|uniref:Uncharacterized protein n=1 Tax=Chiloscyllium punctatum TaxID=137246 RepID=A0A401RIN5_CHIPU|nr:hypothetical protein [Chiloscyllium punctatum]
MVRRSQRRLPAGRRRRRFRFRFPHPSVTAPPVAWEEEKTFPLPPVGHSAACRLGGGEDVSAPTRRSQRRLSSGRRRHFHLYS